MKARLTTMGAILFLLAAGAWGTMQALAHPAGDAVNVPQIGQGVDDGFERAELAKKKRKVRGPADKLDFVNYRRAWRIYYA